jgi:TonB-linked SusC/RagA family outer membrane protein
MKKLFLSGSLEEKDSGGKQTGRVMKLTTGFLLLCSAFAFANPANSQNAKVSLNKQQAHLSEVLEAIESQTDYLFISNRNIDLKQNVSVNVSDVSVREVLETILKNTGLTFKLEGVNIVLSKRDEDASAQAAQQDRKITGTVVDQTGYPVIGANVVVKGTTNGTVTDLDGKFSLEVPAGAVLSITYIGYVEQEMKVGNESVLAVVLKEDSQALDEVVVVGYGTQKKVNVIGSIAMVGAEKLENRATSSVVSALTGQMPGVTITQPGGRPGDNTGTIRVRGVGSFGATPDALVLIDGIPGNMTDINPNDIESVSVLKDASTAAIYGARAANGVVLVTTKLGKEQKVAISYNGYVGFNRATELPQYVDSWDYARLLNQAEGITRFTDADIQAMRDGSQPDRWANEKFVDDIFSGNGIQTGHDISVTGGNDRSQYFTSFGYLSQDGIVPGNNYSRYTARVNLTSNLTDNLKMTVRMRGDHATTKEPGTAGAIDGDGMLLLIQQGLRFPGYRPSMLSDGTWGPGVKNFGTPKAWLASESFSEKPVKRFNATVSLDYEPIKGLKLTATGAYNFTNAQEKDYKATLPVNIDGTINTLGPSKLKEKNTNTEYKSFQATANYVKTFNELHNLDVLVGYSWEDERERDLEAGRQNFPNNNYPYLTVGSPDVQTNTGGGKDWVIQSVFGRAQYNYAERYLAEVTMRYDGSSRFPSDSRYAFFPSGAIGWRISEENFMKENEKLSFISNLKLKASVGILGNNNIGNYAYHSVYVLGNEYNYPLGGVIQQGAQLVNYTDPKLKWETTRTVDAGFESILWNGLLSANISYFHRYTYDILFKPNASASSIFGLNMSEVNTGEALNHGWEFEVGHRNTIGEFSYGVNANFSVINNEVKSLGVGNVDQPNGMVGNGSDLFIGYPMQMYYGYLTDGVFTDQADIDAWFAHTDQSAFGRNQANTKPGDIRYKDISGPDGVPDGKVDATYDRVYLGSRIPKYTFGVSLNAAYKGFDLNIFLQGVAGVKGMLNNYSAWAFFSEGNVQKWQMEEAFDPENPNRYAKYPRLENIGTAGGHNTQTSDYWVRNASYLRIKNIQLGYTLPKKLLQNSVISSLRIYAAAENPFTFHSYPDGWDPEINSAKDDAYSGGQFYPVLRNFTFGVNLKF